MEFGENEALRASRLETTNGHFRSKSGPFQSVSVHFPHNISHFSTVKHTGSAQA